MQHTQTRSTSSDTHPQTKCGACGNILSAGSVFCENCGPPKPPPEPSGESMTPRQTALWIMAIVMVFVGGAVYKADPDWPKFYRDMMIILSTDIKKTSVEPLADDADFQTIHYIHVVKANLRAKGTTKSKVVAVLDQNQTVVVLKNGKRWSQVQVNGKIGWISNKLLSTRVE